jgi:hypothetical protein
MKFLCSSIIALCSIFCLCQPSLGKPLPPSFRDPANLSYSKRKALIHSAESGNVSAALSLANYYTLIEKNPRLRERFLTLSAKFGSKEGRDALVAFYVEPGGIFHPRKALALRRDYAKRFPSNSSEKDRDWAYKSSLEFKYFNDPKRVSQRRELLRLAESLGSRQAGEELAGITGEPINRVRIAPSKLKGIVDDPATH